MSVSIQNVSHFFGSQAALNQVDLDVPSPQVLGLLGPNGAGKSTLMRMITGFLTPTSGAVFVCEQSVDSDPIFTKAKVGYLPEHNPIHTEMYVREYLEYVAQLHGLSDRKDRVHEIILRVGLNPEAHKLIGQLSKGYRQRVGLAQALIHDPEVLILDEPTSGLDPIQLVGIRDLIREVGKKRTVILSTHIMQEVEAMCERVVIINQGELVADGSVAEFSSAPGGLEAVFQSLVPAS
ncbi:MAG: ATP-binding cassette domain-containing protein [Bacteroidetes bacterium]|nr:ATP-binding cassette domain-containing protein [Bacteroidota bacterium]